MNKKNIEEFEYAIKLKKEGKLEEAKKYFIKAADLGCSDAFIELGQLEVPDAGENYYNYSKLDVTLLPMPYHIAEFKWYEKGVRYCTSSRVPASSAFTKRMACCVTTWP